MPQKYRTRIDVGHLDGRPFLDLQFANGSPYPVKYLRLVVPIVHEPLNSYSESGDVELFLDFPNAIVPQVGLLGSIYDCRTNQKTLLTDFEAAAFERIQDAITCSPFDRAEDFVFRSSAGVKPSSEQVPEGPRIFRAKPGPIRKGSGEE